MLGEFSEHSNQHNNKFSTKNLDNNYSISNWYRKDDTKEAFKFQDNNKFNNSNAAENEAEETTAISPIPKTGMHISLLKSNKPETDTGMFIWLLQHNYNIWMYWAF